MVTLLQRNTLPEDALQELLSYSDDLSEQPNYWMTREDIERRSCRNAAERAITSLHALVQTRLPEDWTGAEYWVQVYQGGRGLAFHFDKDEHAMKEEGKMVNPVFSSVLYLTGREGDAAVPCTSQAPTVITDQRFSHEAGCPIPEDPTSSTLVFPLKNSYCLFDGALGHGVLDSGYQHTRATLLVNWWLDQPQAIGTFPGDGSEAPQIQQQEQDSREGAAASDGGVRLPKIEIDEDSIIPGDLLLVDDLLQMNGVALDGQDCVHAVTIHHPGLAMMPIDSEQLQSLEEKPKVGGAFLHLSVLETSDSDSS